MALLHTTPYKVDWLAIWSYLPLREIDLIKLLPTQVKRIQLENQLNRLQRFISDNPKIVGSRDDAFLAACDEIRNWAPSGPRPYEAEDSLLALEAHWKAMESFVCGNSFQRGKKTPKLNGCELARVLITQEKALLKLIELEKNFTPENLAVQELYVEIIEITSVRTPPFPGMDDFPVELRAAMEELHSKRNEIFFQDTDITRIDFFDHILKSNMLISGKHDELIFKITDWLDEINIWLQWGKLTS